MRFNLDKKLILESIDQNVLHRTIAGETMSGEEIHQAALRKMGKNINDISSANHEIGRAKMMGVNTQQIIDERNRETQVHNMRL